MQKNEKLPENIKPEMIGDKRYVHINEGPFKTMTASTKIMYAVLMEK